jgi:putative intracellular protease/amidase
MNTRVLFAVTSHDRKGDTGQPTGFYLPEAAHPYAVLAAAGCDIDFVSPRGGRPPMDGVNREDPVSRAFLDDPAVIGKLANTPTPERLRPEDYAAIFFVGGHGAMWDFPDHPPLARLAERVHAAGGVVGAVCHGPAGLVNLRGADGEYLVKGRRIAAFTDDEERAVQLERVVPFLLATALQQRGAIHVAAPNWNANVVVDGRFVTGQNPASAEGVGQAMARLLKP